MRYTLPFLSIIVVLVGVLSMPASAEAWYYLGVSGGYTGNQGAVFTPYCDSGWCSVAYDWDGDHSAHQWASSAGSGGTSYAWIAPAGTYSFWAVTVDGSGWSGWNYYTFTVSDPPKPTVSMSIWSQPRAAGTSAYTAFTPRSSDGAPMNVAIRWGDGSAEEWSNNVQSGTDRWVAHTYANPGTYQIQAAVLHAYDSSVSKWEYSTITVSAPQCLIDLTVTATDNPSGIAGQPITLGGTIYNSSPNADAGRSNAMFVVDTNGQPGWEANIPVPNGSISRGGSLRTTRSYTFPTPGTYQYQICADSATDGGAWGGMVSETNEGNNCTAGWVTVGSPAYPDLTAGQPAAVSGTPYQNITLSAPISNIGSGATPASFNNLFRIDTNGDGNADFYPETNTPALGAGASRTVTSYYAFGTPGTYRYSVCADNNASWVGTVTESNEGNNCSGWASITVTTPTPPSVSCTVDDTTADIGQQVQYRAVPSGGASSPYTWTASDGGSYGSGTTVNRTFSIPGTYAMNVGASGAATPGYCPNVVVSGSYCTGGTPDLDIKANPNRVKPGQTARITWSARNVIGSGTSCTISGPGVNQTVSAGAAPSCSIPDGEAFPTISAQSTYTITCGTATKSVIVNLLPKYEEF